MTFHFVVNTSQEAGRSSNFPLISPIPLTGEISKLDSSPNFSSLLGELADHKELDLTTKKTKEPQVAEKFSTKNFDKKEMPITPKEKPDRVDVDEQKIEKQSVKLAPIDPMKEPIRNINTFQSQELAVDVLNDFASIDHSDSIFIDNENSYLVDTYLKNKTSISEATNPLSEKVFVTSDLKNISLIQEGLESDLIEILPEKDINKTTTELNNSVINLEIQSNENKEISTESISILSDKVDQLSLWDKKNKNENAVFNIDLSTIKNNFADSEINTEINTKVDLVDIEQSEKVDLDPLFPLFVLQQNDINYSKNVNHQISSQQSDQSENNSINNIKADNVLIIDSTNSLKTDKISNLDLKNIATDQQVEMPKFTIKMNTPLQNISPLITPIIISNKITEDIHLALDSEINLDGNVPSQKSFSFIEASSQQKQLLDKNNDGNAGGDKESFSKAKDGNPAQVSNHSAEALSKTLAFQKLTQTIRDRAEEAMRLQQKDVTINVKVPHPTLGDVNLDLKIKSNKLSVDLTSNNKSMQLMLNQNRGEIKKILDGLVKDSEYELDANPVQIYNKNGEI